MSAIWLKKSSLDRLVAGEVEINTEIPFSELPRLADVVLPGTSGVNVRLSLKESSKGIVLVDGSVSAELQLTCQRCLEAMPVPVDNTIRLALLRREEQDAFRPPDYEAVLIGDDEVRLADFVEDEILLELPIAPRHADKQCNPLVSDVQASQDSEQETNKAFAGLADIMRNSH